MPIQHAIWTVSTDPQEIRQGILPSEQMLEDMIVKQPRILSSDWMLIGRQVDTGLGGRVDLLAITPDGSLVLVELKRDKTPREVVAQALDYAAWLEKLEAEDVVTVYSRFRPGQSLSADFLERFGQVLDEDTLNESHQIVIVAAELDSSSERIVSYLNDRGLAINVLFFQVFDHGTEQLLSRAWLIDPGEVQVKSVSTGRKGEKEPWNGEYYVSYGEGLDRSWTEAVKFGFVCGGGGTWYSNSLRMLSEGDRIWVKIPGQGFVGVGRVTGSRLSASEFKIEDKPALEVLTARYHRQFEDDAENCEYFVPVEWEKTVSSRQAVQELGMFGNQNTVCKPVTPSWRTTVDRLKTIFGISI
ncbi:endonuclease NucS domain-containing protein [Cohaesibacter haloalkalitolerans]|uniref:endonuclease NucS domain-containing protein n=1 Tax=Cohaesibacter haloalkalitolerans TaxID=1162980 RepID=UPI000E646683|nr:endonuclease NucS domain-containing protein [Cohaesibacter haloalkalitolerans]